MHGRLKRSAFHYLCRVKIIGFVVAGARLPCISFARVVLYAGESEEIILPGALCAIIIL